MVYYKYKNQVSNNSKKNHPTDKRHQLQEQRQTNASVVVCKLPINANTHIYKYKYILEYYSAGFKTQETEEDSFTTRKGIQI